MSQTYFSKQDPTETMSRLNLLGLSKGTVTLWLKGKKEKYRHNVLSFDKDRMEIALDSMEQIFTPGETVLCSFELRGMTFFSEVAYQVSVRGYDVLHFKNTLYKSERRTSYRLLTYPHYEAWAEFEIGESYKGSNLIDLKTRQSQTGLFKSFLKMVDETQSDDDLSLLKIRIQDLSTTGMALHVSEIEVQYFKKDQIFNNVRLRFSDESIVIPEVKIVYVIDLITNDRNLKKYKLGVHFEKLSTKVDDQIGRKINSLLRENDQNKDFENLIK